ncbi:histidinol-phosphatase (PHP family) [Desulfitispora alkaliphila]|uniref:histidinol-phosphatase HisJ family protein n=1 Tax=Desulfitispora alkaliphila TaxID=622674 RepID=UPI003D237841
MIVDYHVHGLAHGEFKHTLEDIKPFVETAIKRGVGELGFTEHDRFFNEIDFDLYETLREMFPQVKIRMGLEVDFRNGSEQEILKQMEKYNFDYIIGSVHEINRWPFDNADFMDEYHKWEEEKLYESYFQIISDMAATGQFQVVGHLDLIKVFGYRSRKDVLEYVEPVLKVIKKSNMAVEINTNGWHKPVKEVYPEEKILRACFSHGIPITTSSDAHRPEQVGRDIDKAIQIAKSIGYKEVATFSNKEMIMQKLG